MCEKIQGTYFKISALYFKIYALCFSSFLLFEKQGLIKRKIKTPARWVPVGIFCCFAYVASYFPYLICRCEFFKESYIVFREKSEVVNLVFEVGDSLYAHSEGITRILF